MKKIFLLLPVILVATSLTMFGRATKTAEPSAETEFNKFFNGAANVVWTKEKDGFLKASFVWAGHRTIAFFDTQAQFAGCIRGLFFNQLPLTIMRSVENNFDKPVVLEVREITNDEGVNYTILLETKNKKYKVVLSSLGEIVKKEKLGK